MKRYSNSKKPRSLDREGCRTVTVGEDEVGVVESPVVRQRQNKTVWKTLPKSGQQSKMR